MSKIRPIAIAVIKNDRAQLLLNEGFDSVKNETFYRPLGGGIDFGERGEQALIREFKEEIDQEIRVLELINTFENIFNYEGKQGHEIVLVYRAEFVSKTYQQSYELREAGHPVRKTVWKSLKEIRAQNSKIYPTGIENYI